MSAKIDLTNQIFGRLTAIRPTEKRHGTGIIWECLCICGNTCFVRTAALKNGHSQSCGCLQKEKAGQWRKEHPEIYIKDEIGNRYNRLLVIKQAGKNQHNSILWECLCDCGKTCIINGSCLRQETTQSCGCYNRDRSSEVHQGHQYNIKHGHTKRKGKKSLTYNSWIAMRVRCTKVDDSHYPYYGGRGITICKEWINSFETFLKDMGERPEDRTLDRIDVNGNYEPGNCRWATIKEQNNNQQKHVKKYLPAGTTWGLLY